MGKELQTINEQNKLAAWAERIAACRSSELEIPEQLGQLHAKNRPLRR